MPEAPSSRSSFQSIQWCIIALLLCFLPFLIACLVVLGLIPLYTSTRNVDISRSNENLTDPWLLEFYTNLYTNESTVIGPINTTTFATSMEKKNGLEPGSLVVSSVAIVPGQKNNGIIRLFRRQNSASFPGAPFTAQLNVVLQIQYPNRCNGMSRCQDSFRKTMFAKFSDQTSFEMSLNFLNGVNMQATLVLSRIVDKFDDFTTQTTQMAGVSSTTTMITLTTVSMIDTTPIASSTTSSSTPSSTSTPPSTSTASSTSTITSTSTTSTTESTSTSTSTVSSTATLTSTVSTTTSIVTSMSTTTTVTTEPTTRAITLMYKLEPSVQVALSGSPNPRKVLLRGDILNKNQIATLQTIIQSKFKKDEITNQLQITINDDSRINGGQSVSSSSSESGSSNPCSKNAKGKSRNMYRRRRQAEQVIGERDTASMNQIGENENVDASLKLSCILTCASGCSDSKVNYVSTVILAKLELPGKSLVNLFYSSLSTLGGQKPTAALLLAVDPSIDLNSPDNLVPSDKHALGFEQLWDPLLPFNSYKSGMNVGFSVPTIVFDHSSLISVVNQTENNIIFGFTTAEAFAKALEWPASGINVLMSGECPLSSAIDALTINGFKYDSNQLTVAATYLSTDLNNISSAMNLNLSPDTNATNDAANSGNPQNYTADVKYADALFSAGRKARTVKTALGVTGKAIDLTTLDESADSALDFPDDCSYNSLSQALTYDIADKNYYSDVKAYNRLLDIVTSSDESDSTNAKKSKKKRATASRRSRSASEVSETDITEYRGPSSRDDLRHWMHLRHLRQTFGNITDGKFLQRYRRGIFDDIGNFFRGAVNDVIQTVSNVINTVVAVVEAIAETVSEVVQIIGTAIFGGIYDKSKTIDILIGPDEPVPIYEESGLSVMCEECNVAITVDIHAFFDFGKNGIETVLNDGYVETKGKVTAKAVGSINGGYVGNKGVEIAKVALTPISIPGILTLGPQAVLEIGAVLEVGKNLKVTFGAHIIWESIETRIDFKNPSNSKSSGWSPDRTEPKFSVDADIVIKVGVYAEPKIELTLEAFGGLVDFAAGLSARGTAGASLSYSQNSPTCSGGVEIGAYVEIGLSAYVSGSIGSTELFNEDFTLFETDFPIPGSFCIGGSALTSTIAPSTTLASTTCNPECPSDQICVKPDTCMCPSGSATSPCTTESGGLCSADEIGNSKPSYSLTFDSGSDKYSSATPESFGFTTTYKQKNSSPLSDNAFSFVNGIPSDSSRWHVGSTDHTPDDGDDGYMMVVGASATTGEICRVKVDDLVVGSRYQFSGYVANIVKSGADLIKPNILFEVRADSSDNTLLASTMTGDIDEYDTLTWTEYGMSFFATSKSIVLLMISKAPGGAGNDFAVDDITLRTCGSSAAKIFGSEIRSLANLTRSQNGDRTMGSRMIHH